MKFTIGRRSSELPAWNEAQSTAHSKRMVGPAHHANGGSSRRPITASPGFCLGHGFCRDETGDVCECAAWPGSVSLWACLKNGLRFGASCWTK
jgi:hypothetical protein